MALSWIQRELARRLPKADLGKGVDLNGDGKIRGSERLVDANRNQQLGDPADWLAFYKKNRSQIVKLGGFFEWGKELKPDNPIHDILSLESDLATASQIEGAYTFIRATFNFKAIDAATTPLDRLKAAFERTHRFGFVYAYKDVNLLSAGIDKSRLDCDTMGFYILAIGHEKGWPVEMVDIPTHTYVRWNNHKGAPLNFDLGDVRTDEYYETLYQVSRSGVYPMVLNRDTLIGHVYFNLGIVRIDRGDFAGAIADFTQAVRLNPKDCAAFNARGVAYLKQQAPHWRNNALADYERALHLNPNHTSAKRNRDALLR